MKTKRVFVDSDAFIALAKEDDTNHKKAIKILEELAETPVSFITSNYVFSETVTVLSMRVGHQEALEFINKIKSPQNLFSIHWINETDETEAIKIFTNQSSKNTSFVDCTNIALANVIGIDLMFSFDGVYKKNSIATV